MENLRLLDVGNTTASFYHKDKIEKVSVKNFRILFHKKSYFYINVNHKLEKRLKNDKYGIDLKEFISFKTKYRGLGIDRIVVCKAIKDGIIVDAGSAITVDIVKNHKHKGGFILQGIYNQIECYKKISKALNFELDLKIDLDRLPNSTKEALNYALLKSIILPIKEVSRDKKIYFTGGDGKKLSKFFSNAIYDEFLIFKGMKKIIKESNAYNSFTKR